MKVTLMVGALLAITTGTQAQAQVLAGPEPAPSSLPSYTTTGAPLFQIPNFIGDRRVDDLYYYMHPVEREQWDTYQRRLQAAAAQIVGQRPLHESPTPDKPNNAAANLMTGLPGTMPGLQSSLSINEQQAGAHCARRIQGAGPICGQVSPSIIRPTTTTVRADLIDRSKSDVSHIDLITPDTCLLREFPLN